MRTDFDERSAGFGCKYGDFRFLTDDQASKMTRVLARVAERSYRRGLHHGVNQDDISEERALFLRFEEDLDNSPFCEDGHGSESGTDAVTRLVMENSCLRDLGIYRCEHHVDERLG